MEAYLATILLWAANFNPRGWAFCTGQLLPISQNAALFSLLGTTYGGNGTTTFALPDFRGRVPVGVGQGPGLSDYLLGQVSGNENVTMTINQMPQHDAADERHDLHQRAKAEARRKGLAALDHDGRDPS